MDALRRLVDPHDVASGRITALLGVLWLTGGGLVLLAAAAGTYADGRPQRVVPVAAAAVVVGVSLLVVRARVLTGRAYGLLVLLGAMAISLVVLWGGPEGGASAAVLYVFVAVFSLVSLRRFAAGLVAVAAGGHLFALLAGGHEDAVGQWLVVWGVALLAGVVTGEVVEANRRAAAEQARLVEQMRHVDATKTATLRAVGHELSMPLTAISGFVTTLSHHGDRMTAAERRRLLERVGANAVRLERSLRDLLRLAELSEGRIALELEPVDLGAVVDRAVELSEVDPRLVRVTGAAGVVVAADGPKLAHAVGNLLANAAKYAGTDEPIDVGVDRRPGTVVVRVEDRGPGIPDLAKSRIFEPFQRARDEDTGRGTGIGLSLVQQFARLHGGDSWAEDRPGGGARLCVSIADQTSSGPPRSDAGPGPR